MRHRLNQLLYTLNWEQQACRERPEKKSARKKWLIFGSRNGPTELEEGRASQTLVDGLKARSHEVKVMTQTSGLQGIQHVVKDGRSGWFGGADPRREGIVMGD